MTGKHHISFNKNKVINNTHSPTVANRLDIYKSGKMLSPNYLLAAITFLCLSSGFVSSFSQSSSFSSTSKNQILYVPSRQNESTNLKMIVMPEPNVLAGAAVGFGGFAVGIGMVTFAENQGERAKERGGGLSDNMSTQLSGGMMEDVEMSSIDDLGSLTSQLEQALKESGGNKVGDLEMSEAEKERIREEAEDGW